MATQADLKTKLDALQADVATLTTVEQSVTQLLTNLTGQISTLQTNMANAGVDQSLLDEVTAITGALDQGKSTLTAAVTANTPAQPAATAAA